MKTPYIHTSPYTGSVQAVVLDWAGTAVDHGCLGPAEVFRRAFEAHGVAVSLEEIRPFMGLKKIDHVRGMLALPAVAEKWRSANGSDADEKAVETVYASTEPLMIEAVTTHATPIPGVVETTDRLRKRGVAVGSCTGYTRPMMEALTPVAKQHGYAPDFWNCSSDVPAGRPWPWMCLQNAIALQTYPMESMVKIGDTVTDIQEGRNAGMWCVGVTRTGNELGLSEDDVASLPADELASRLQVIATRLLQAGAHFVVASVADIEPVIDTIENLLSQGRTPLFPGTP